MARPPITIKIANMPAMARLFTKVAEFGKDPTELLDLWGGVLVSSTLRRFDTGRGPGGVPWPPTKRQIAGAVGPRGPNKRKILVDKGDLQDSTAHRVEPKRLEVGFLKHSESTRQAHVHQFGFEGTVNVRAHNRTITSMFGVPLPEPKEVRVKAHDMKMRIPKRPMLGVDELDKADMLDVARGFLEDLIDG